MGEQQGSEYYDGLWRKMEDVPEVFDNWKPLWRAIASEIEDRKIRGVVDVGCGLGHLAELLYHNENIDRYLGIDFSEYAIAKCRERTLREGFEFLQRDVLKEGVPYMTDGIGGNAYVFCEILEHVNDDYSLLECVPDGDTIILTVPTFDDAGHVRHFLESWRVAQRYKDYFHRGYDLRELPTKNHFMMSGFRREQKEPINKSGITLYMIVRNEEMGIKRAIESTGDLCAEAVVLVDVATTDKTEERAQGYMVRTYPYEWTKDFGHARNTALEKVRTKWGLVLDGHEFLKGDLKQIHKAIHEHPDAGNFEIEVVMEDGKSHMDPHRLHRVEGAKWNKPRHNFLTAQGPTFKVEGVQIIHDRNTGQSMESRVSRSKQRDEELVSGFREDIRKNPKDTRSMYYLAQQHRDSGRWEAAYYWYDRYNRTEGGSQWTEERFLANYNAGRCAIAIGDYDMALWHGKQAVDRIGVRAEGWALRGDAHYAKKENVRALRAYEKAAGCDIPENAKLPVDATIYRGGWKVLDQMAMCCWHVSNHERGAELCRVLLLMKDLPERERKRIGDNLDWHEKRIEK